MAQKEHGHKLHVRKARTPPPLPLQSSLARVYPTLALSPPSYIVPLLSISPNINISPHVDNSKDRTQSAIW